MRRSAEPDLWVSSKAADAHGGVRTSPGLLSGRGRVVLILLVLGTLAVVLAGRRAARRSRQRFWNAGETFRCRLRVRGFRSAVWPSLRRHWSRPMWARWDEDVLVVRRGPVLAREIPLGTQPPESGVRSLLFEAPRLCGSRPVGVVLKISDGSHVQVATATEDRVLVVGPYLTAALEDLPPAPAPPPYL
jgi:hypothetical protein